MSPVENEAVEIDPLLATIARNWVLLLLLPAVVAIVTFFVARSIPIGYFAEVVVPIERATAMPLLRSIPVPPGISVNTQSDWTSIVARGASPEGLDGSALGFASEVGRRANDAYAALTERDQRTIDVLAPFYDALRESQLTDAHAAQAVAVLIIAIANAEASIEDAGNPVVVPTTAGVYPEHRDALGLAIVCWFGTGFVMVILLLHLSDRRKARMAASPTADS